MQRFEEQQFQLNKSYVTNNCIWLYVLQLDFFIKNKDINFTYKIDVSINNNSNTIGGSHE